MQVALNKGVLLSIILLMSFALQAQTNSANISANIVHPVGLFGDEPVDFTEVYKTSEGIATAITLAGFKIDTDLEDLFNITVPNYLLLYKGKKNDGLNAKIKQEGYTSLIMNTGQKQITVNSELELECDQPAFGKHSTSPYEVTVNFN